MADPNENSEISMDSDISDFDIEETHKKAATLKIQESTSEEIDADIEEPQTEPNQNEKKLGNKDELLIPRNDFAKDVAEMKSSIEKALSTLANLKQHPRRLPRKEYVERIASNAAELYSYSRELVDLFLGMFSPAECIRFLEANERARPVTIRANSIRTKRKELAKSLIERFLRN
ncbi:hypothetical protein MHBO_002182 [Bonamia ostreae]|uniref:Uncharacterized protein n=1 Tax=Bonamia ostreae TaxID=126728 RepID=A0ABV2ALF2_9EUKA